MRACVRARMLTVGTALVIGSTLILVSLLTALGVAQRWPRHALELREAEEEGQQQRFDFGGMVPTASGDEDPWHAPPPRLSLGHLTERPSERSRAQPALVGLRLA